MVNAQGWLDQNYPLEIRKNTTKLDIKQKNLEGSLVISDWPNLLEIDCSENLFPTLTFNNLLKVHTINAYSNQTSNLVITNCSQLQTLSAWGNNCFSNLSFLDNLDPSKLKALSIAGYEHTYPSQNLTIFSKFVNLEGLYIEGHSLHGSLEPLKSLTKLERLGINISDGLEYLPTNLKLVYSNGEEVEKVLKNCFLKVEWRARCYDYQVWRKEQLVPYLISKVGTKEQQIQELQKQVSQLTNQLNRK